MLSPTLPKTQPLSGNSCTRPFMAGGLPALPRQRFVLGPKAICTGTPTQRKSTTSHKGLAECIWVTKYLKWDPRTRFSSQRAPLTKWKILVRKICSFFAYAPLRIPTTTLNYYDRHLKNEIKLPAAGHGVYLKVFYFITPQAAVYYTLSFAKIKLPAAG